MRFRTFAVATLLAAASFTQTGAATAAAPVHTATQRNVSDDEGCPFPGAQQKNGTGFDTCVPGGEWVYQDCPPGTASVQGWGAAKWHIWCIVPE